MIQEPLMEILKQVIPDLTWTVDYRTANDNTGTVYSTGGSSAESGGDTRYRYPTYQVFIRSSDWDYSKTAAEITYSTLDERNNFVVDVPYWKDGKILFTKRFQIYRISAMSDPIRVGDNGGIMEYSVNFDVTLSEIKEETING